jgi:endonuclease YncB( thermonuclease family)
MGTLAATICIGVQCFASSVYVYDGDTFKATYYDNQFRKQSEWYRIAGIDAPEIKGDCSNEKVIAQAARIRLEGLLRQKTIYVDVDAKRDRYKRLLSNVKVDGADVGEIILQDGLARRWTKKWDHKPEPWCDFEG